MKARWIAANIRRALPVSVPRKEAGMPIRFLAGTALAAISAGSVFAADLPVKAAAPVVVYEWTGVYIGGLIGGAWSTHDVSDQALGPLLGAPYAQGIAASGLIGGVDGGARYQFGKLVLGVEGDITWGNLNGTNADSFGPDSFTISRAITADTKWTATAAATFGIAGDGDWLLYGKAGVAFANTGYTDSWSVPGMLPFGGTATETTVGWTAGTGVEWAFSSAWSLKVEYDYLDFGKHNVTINESPLGPGVMPMTQDRNHINQFKAGLNWRIGPIFW
jgi:outer membrane immunogenic protein